MRMGLYGVHFDGNGQRVRVLDDVVGVARRDVDVLTTQPHNRRSALRRFFAEVQSDRRIHRLGLAGWLQVNLEHDVRSGLQSPGHPVRQKGCRLSGRPGEKVSVRKLRRVCHHAVVAGRRVLTIEVPRRRRPVDPDVGMVDDARVVRAELEATNISDRRDRHAQNKRSEDIGALGAEVVRGHRQNQVRRTELPPERLAWRRRKIPGVAFELAAVDPALNETDLRVREVSLPDKLSRLRCGFPGRHIPAPRHRSNLRRALPDVGVREETERCGTVRLVALRATVEDERRNLTREGDRRRRILGRRSGYRDRADGAQRRERHSR